MTRANLNFVYQNRGESPRTLFHYHNGDQYPSGLRDFYGIMDFLKIDHLWTPEDFKNWISENYKVYQRVRKGNKNGVSIEYNKATKIPAKVKNLGEGGQPKIYYTDGFITDYSYVFTHENQKVRQTIKEKENKTQRFEEVNWVKAWNWNKLVFDGSTKKAIKWFEKQSL